MSTRKERKYSVSFVENGPQCNGATEMECNVEEPAHLSQVAKHAEEDTNETSFSSFGRQQASCINILYVLSLLVPEKTAAIAVTEFPDYVQRMMREDEDKNTMLANEYNMTIKVSHHCL